VTNKLKKQLKLSDSSL